MKHYKVFEIDRCFDDYASDLVLAGGTDVQDILDHFKDIFPDLVYVISREDWMSDTDWNDVTHNGKYQEGDVMTISAFTADQMIKFEESLDPDNAYPRITEIPHLFTDTPYMPLQYFGYRE